MARTVLSVPSKPPWYGHLARACGTDSLVRALVGGDADATLAWTRLSKPRSSARTPTLREPAGLSAL
ncbi:MAG: hypothetical protein NZ874_08325 [Fimbriimonadales bacterium]|nr:hypothetical protein [Fimbriimonadales bacterium]